MTDASHLDGRRVLVTGASGFIGGHVCLRLLELGAEVHGVSRRQQSRAEANGLTWWTVELADAAETKRLLDQLQPDIVFHLAGLPVGKRDIDVVLPTLRNNLLPAIHILTYQRRESRIVLAGSQEEPATTDRAGSAPSSPYAASKWAASAYARMFHLLFDTPAVIARIFMAYGPGQRGTVIPYVTRCFLSGVPPDLTSASRLVDWIYIQDLVEGLLAVGLRPGIEGATVDLGSGFLVSVRDVVERLRGLTDASVTPRFGVMADRLHEQVRVADVAATERLVGFRCRTTLDSGLSETVSWHRNHRTESEISGPHEMHERIS